MSRGMGKDKISPDRGVTKISIEWHYTDIIERAEGRNERAYASVPRKVPTKKQAREILYNIKESHNSDIGINWDVIDIHTDNYFEYNS